MLSPLHFGVASFFHWRSYFLSPLRFGVASFFIGCLYFEPMSEGCANVPSVVALA
jgi:hypothetical protein